MLSILVIVAIGFMQSAYAADGQKIPKEHTLNDERIQNVVANSKEGGYASGCLPPCSNTKLSRIIIWYDLRYAKPLCITHKIYIDLLDPVRKSDRCDAPGFDDLLQYLDEGYSYQIRKAIPRYYKPLISWVSKQIGLPLPKDCCEKIVAYIDRLPDSAPCEIFKAEAMIMLRYAAYAYNNKCGNREYDKQCYKVCHQFPPAIDALW